MAEKPSPIISSPSEGYPVNIFPSRFVQRFACKDCTKLLRNPVQSKCGHLFCKTCAESTGEQGTCIDDEDHTICDFSKMFPDNAVKREMSIIESHCINKGCNWKGLFKNYEKHINECLFKEMPCRNCSILTVASKLQEHLANECPSRKMACKNCNMEIKFKDQEEHNKICPKALIKCELCGKEKILREKMQQHKDIECSNQMIDCPLGCGPIERRASL